MKIVINNYRIVKILDIANNEIEPESLQGTKYWNMYCIVEAMLYTHVRKLDYGTTSYYMYYPYRKLFDVALSYAKQKNINQDKFEELDIILYNMQHYIAYSIN